MDSTSNLSAARAETGLQRLVRLRWFLLAGEALVILAVPPLLDIPLQSGFLLTVVVLLAGFNGLASRRAAQAAVIEPMELLGQVVVDMVGLGVLLFFSGGAANPLVSLLLLPVTVAALMLPWRYAAGAAVLAVVLYSLLTVRFVPLPIADPERATNLHLAGMWLTFVFSVALIVWLIVRMTASIRERDAQLATAREQALRQERVVALGALAAGAAHELGTPLATMAVLAGELERDARLGVEAQADLAVLREQIAVCKGIITGLAARAGAGRFEDAQAARADRWLAALVDRWRQQRPKASCRLEIAEPSPAPTIVAEATLEQGLLNLFNNAANAGRHVTVAADWDEAWLRVKVSDDGPGFPDEVLRQAGKATLPAHANGSGIGLFLAYAAVERLGGRLILENLPEGGGLARVELPLAQIGEQV